MSTKKQNDILRALTRILLVFILLFGQTARATPGQNGQDKPDSKPAAKSQRAPTRPSAATEEKVAPLEEEAAKPKNSSAEEHSQSGRQHEGIKVHGHWTVEVRNPDGTLVTHREFENSLQPSGVTLLADVLNGAGAPGAWAIVLDGIPTSPWLPVNVSGTNTNILLAPVSDTSALILPSNAFLAVPDSNAFLNLISNRTGNGQLVLSGSALATQSGSVSIVSTYLETCGNVFSPTNCVNHTGGAAGGFPFKQFTAAMLSSPVQVSAGQTVAATVTISFS